MADGEEILLMGMLRLYARVYLALAHVATLLPIPVELPVPKEDGDGVDSRTISRAIRRLGRIAPDVPHQGEGVRRLLRDACMELATADDLLVHAHQEMHEGTVDRLRVDGIGAALIRAYEAVEQAHSRLDCDDPHPDGLSNIG
ncbi:hypothetical protein GCM10027160_29100 [Streptomyces calidiresistens]|uniref:Uncharacterized protein n=1 Tax=Streptomyces calidiresistens TaxID=1485586 RepID=A0A7W3T246_9ACTN|nr:hypothetical protein [Streptomyces calidiresistens]MBB0229503.1 hypothetical protein [Streptomyces calidiresistens]